MWTFIRLSIRSLSCSATVAVSPMALYNANSVLMTPPSKISRQNSLSPNASQWMSTDRSWYGREVQRRPCRSRRSRPPQLETSLKPEAERGDGGGIRLYGALHLALMLLQHEGRLTYRTLIQLCGLDQALMEAIRDELLFKRVARDEHGQGLVWRDAVSAVRASPPASTGAADRLETPPVGLPAIVPAHGPITAMDSTPAAAPSPWAATADDSPPRHVTGCLRDSL